MIIGLGHRSRHGKDTVANFMIDWLRRNRPSLTCQKLSLSWKMKEIAFELYSHLGLGTAEFYEDEDNSHLRNVKLPKINKTPVEIWIDIGTAAFREQVWDLTWPEWLKSKSGSFDVTIVPDIRFPNEIPYCDSTVKVTNFNIPNREGKSADEYLADYEGWDYHITNVYNPGGLPSRAAAHENLKRRSCAVLQTILEEKGT